MEETQNKKWKRFPGIVFALAVFFSLACVLTIQAENLKIQVTARRANIRLKPTLQSQVIGTALEGQVLEVLQRTGDWYQIRLGPDSNGVTVLGYIHKSVVELVEEEEQALEETRAKPVIPEPKPPAEAPKRVSTAPDHRPATAGSAAFRPARKNFYVRLSGGYNSFSCPYENSRSFSLYYEDGLVAEDYKIKASSFALDAGIGFLFHKNIGVELSFIPASGKSQGTFSASFPHPLYFENPREANWEKGGLKYAASELNLNLILTFPLLSRLQLYLTAGGTYFLNVKLESLKAVNWEEAGYPYFEVNVNPQYASYTQNTFGFNGGAGFDYWLTRSAGINVQARYSDGQAKFDIEGNKIEIKTGGLRASAGIKLAF